MAQRREQQGPRRRQAPLDDIDKVIVRELQIDGRVSYAQLGPRVGLSQAATRQRVQRLIDSGVMQVVAVTDPTMLGFSVQAMIGMNVSGDARTVAETIAGYEIAEYVILCAGRYDVLAEVVAADNEDLLTIVNDSIRSIDGVTDVEIMTYLRLVKQTYSWGTR